MTLVVGVEVRPLAASVFSVFRTSGFRILQDFSVPAARHTGKPVNHT